MGYLVLPSGDEGLGTIGDARQWGITARGTLPLDRALKGARLTVDGTWRGSRLRDPVTGRRRAMDDIPDQSLTAEFRHDVPALKSSWGINWTAAEQADVFYTGEALRWRDHSLWGAYVETTAVAGFKMTLTAKAINGQDKARSRHFFAPSRAGAFTGSEQRSQKQGVVGSLAIARTF